MNTLPSSRTPEGNDNHCFVCGHDVRLDPTRPPGDAPCPHCGTLLWFAADSTESVATKQAAVIGARAQAAIAQERINVAIRLLQKAVSLDPTNAQFKTTLSELQTQHRSDNSAGRRMRRRRRQAN